MFPIMMMKWFQYGRSCYIKAKPLSLLSSISSNCNVVFLWFLTLTLRSVLFLLSKRINICGTAKSLLKISPTLPRTATMQKPMKVNTIVSTFYVVVSILSAIPRCVPISLVINHYVRLRITQAVRYDTIMQSI